MVEVDNFVECTNLEEANRVDLSKYTFIGFRRDCYAFKVRQRF